MVLVTALLLAAGALVPAPETTLAAVQVTDRAFDAEIVMAVAGLPAEPAQEALRRALREIHEVEELTDPDGDRAGGLGRINAGAGGGEVAVDQRLAELLARALDFCRWSGGATGPLGGHLYRLWERDRTAAGPPPEALAPAVAAAGCNGLVVDARSSTAVLEAGRRADLRTLAAGYAADRAVAALRESAADGFVEVAGVTRAFGPGPGGRGWPVTLPEFPGLVEPLEQVWLRDQALAVAAREDGRPAASASAPPYLDLRRGRQPEGVRATLVVSVLGVDAQGLATSLFAIGSRDGQLRLGGLRPRPSVLWLLGSGAGAPLLVDYRWAQVHR